jgi:hypothetical protein
VQIDVQQFIDCILAQTKEPGKYVHAEVQRGVVRLVEHMAMADKYFHRSPGQAHIFIGHQILSHYYGEIMAITFRRWIEENFSIGCDDGDDADEEDAAATTAPLAEEQAA